MHLSKLMAHVSNCDVITLFVLIVAVRSLSRVLAARQGFPWSDSSENQGCLHRLPDFAQTHVHRVSDAVQPSRPLSSPSPPAFDLSQHQGLFQ